MTCIAAGQGWQDDARCESLQKSSSNHDHFIIITGTHPPLFLLLLQRRAREEPT
jgi:hypothetical protein